MRARAGLFTPLLVSNDASSISKAPQVVIASKSENSDSSARNGLSVVQGDRDVVRCVTCGLVQYRTRNGNCRKCLHLLTPKVQFLVPPLLDTATDDQPSTDHRGNRATVENIGERIRQLRELRGITQSQLQGRSRVSRSYLSRIESGQMTPSIGTIEKISEALGIGINRFFTAESHSITVLEDPFIQELRPFLKQLDWAQWRSILKRLAAIGERVSTEEGQGRSLAAPESASFGKPRFLGSQT